MWSTPDLVAVPGGQVTLTDRRTQRSWLVDVGAIEVGRCPVSQAEYAEVTGQRPAAVRADRLPVEAEWEFACRAGTLGPRSGDLDAVAWYRGNSDGGPHEVGVKTPNEWGLDDMLGNVWEWCWDLYDPEVYDTYRVLRGGGWSDEHWSCRASVRRRSHPTYRVDDVGFRIARGRQL